MCTALFAFGVHPRLLFFLAFNRDEFLDRPTSAATWWEDEPTILAGRDQVRKGTWLGMSRSGRFAFLTNFREVKYDSVTEGPSRGTLVVDYLKGSENPIDYLSSLDTKSQNGFNLIVGDLGKGSVAYLTNRDPANRGPLELERGMYGISNGVLHSAWPKTEKGTAMMKREDLVPETMPWEEVLDRIMYQCGKEDLCNLPETGLDRTVEHQLSSIFIQPIDFKGRRYGTQTQTAVAGWADGRVEYREKVLHSVLEEPGNLPKLSKFEVPLQISDAWHVPQQQAHSC